MDKIDLVTYEQLVKKYDVPVPRYTSYPSVPFWNTDHFNMNQWLRAVKRTFTETNQSKGISVYIHLPFCESLCTYCACNTRITKNHKVEDQYIHSVLKEWQQYLSLFPERPVIRELHLGGGTPTFFAPEKLHLLIQSILQSVQIHPLAEFSFEGHPNNTTLEHLKTLSDLGFRRVSYGVQDLNEKVQKAINRIQPFENLERVTRQSRESGYESISFDLIYGLPYQTKDTVEDTVKKTITLRPDRIAFYSYAHVPWMRPGQRGYEDSNLPGDVLKRSLYETGRKLFLEAGYLDIGMDHFALPNDALTKARREGNLHRNFMGYTTSSTDLLIGLGVSSISDAKYAYAQNLKKVEDYEKKVSNGEWAIFKGHLHSTDDLIFKRCILDIACKGELASSLLQEVLTHSLISDLKSMQNDEIISFSQQGLKVTELGRAFIRNICSAFDQTVKKDQDKKIFSQAI